jgi:GxxExxY protein
MGIFRGLVQPTEEVTSFFYHEGTRRIFTKTPKDIIMTAEEIFSMVLDCSFKVHSGLGPGLLESSYEECLFYELSQNGLLVEKQKPLPLIYNEVKLDIGYRIDLFVEKQVIVEIKSVEGLNEIHFSQILTYLKLSGCKLGLLINFNVRHLKDGIKRIIL